MPHEIQKTCHNCHNQIVLIAHQTLGAKDSDSIECPKCGTVIMEWHKEAIYYTIKGEEMPPLPSSR
jgi:predicted Zn finger-like uncharacterized protein